MRGWQIHFVNACGQLDGYVDAIADSLEKTRRLVETVTPPLALDVIVQAIPGRVIPELGFVGFAPSGQLIYLTFDPDNPAMKENLGEPLARQIAHELHHVHRWRGPGYGRSLGDAIVSEGLAGRFCEQLFRSPPELWERAVAGADLTDCARAARKTWASADYDHNRWFFGTGDIPRWAGYSLGYAIAGRVIESRPGSSAASLVNEPAGSFLTALEELAA